MLPRPPRPSPIRPSRGPSSRLFRAGLGVVALGLVAGAVLGGRSEATSASEERTAEMARPDASRGLVYTGLAVGDDDRCTGQFSLRDRAGHTIGCTHGPDPAPPGVDVRDGRSTRRIRADATPPAGRAAAAAPGAIGCIGDGTSGQRVEAIYAVPAGRTDRSATVVPAIRATYAPRIDGQLNASAAETGGEAHPTFVTEPTTDGTNCRLVVSVARLSATADDSFGETITQLKALGFTRTDRKYLVWMDANVLCGIAAIYDDVRPTQDNLNNGRRVMFGRVDTACWGTAEGHELMHNLGAVQFGAPHSTPNAHCWDEPDEMCYDDDGIGPVGMQTVCRGRSGILFDCNHDDYFYAGTPPAGNWLATHWNTYNSRFLHAGPLESVAGPAPPDGGTPVPPATTTTTAPVTLPPPPVTVPPAPAEGYWMLAADGTVYPFGTAGRFGEPAGGLGGASAVDLEPTPTGNGYWVVDDGGRVHAFGDAAVLGGVDLAGLAPGDRPVSLSATPTGAGYWIFTSGGRAIRFGDAPDASDMGATTLNRPVVGSVATPTGKGYYMVAGDGGIFSFGDAAFRGSTGNIHLNQPIKAMAPAPGGQGYWLVAADGGVFAFDVPFHGSMGGTFLNRPISAMVPGPGGYLMVGADGGVFSFGDVAFLGSLGTNPPERPIVSVALVP